MRYDIEEERRAIEEGENVRPIESEAAPESDDPHAWFRDDTPQDAPAKDIESMEPQISTHGAPHDLPYVRILSTAEIFAPRPPTRWLVPALQLAPGRPALMYGSAGAGKSVIAQSLALFIAAGLPAWGQFPTRAGRVLHIDYDQGEGATRKRYSRLAAGHRIDRAALGDRLRFTPFPAVYLNSREIEPVLLYHCQDVDFCIIDALRGALPNADENDSRVGAWLTKLARVSAQTGTTFMVLHHLGKPKDAAPDSPMMPRGSSALLAASGAALLVTGSKDGPKRIRMMRDSESYDGDAFADFVLRFEDVPAQEGRPLRVVFDGAAPASPTDDKTTTVISRIVDHVRAHPGVSGNAVCEAIGGNKANLLDAIRDLVQGGALRHGSGRRGLFVVENAEGEGANGSAVPPPRG